ncbi:MAG: hypothetical protein LBC69_04435, partial [Eubacteriaceae bacterium]|jgi:MoaA/NifB/PqqE/SkfB family radical SAM enzyme|nr:hypothetical protein [Eubacteriaceae bacterium]
MGKFIPAVQKSSTKRTEYQQSDSVYVPTFILMSISNEGTGLYRCIEDDRSPAPLMTQDEWRAFYQHIADLGVNACLLALGEPLLNRPALEVCAEYPEILFGAVCDPRYMSDEHIDFFAKNQNILPLLTVDMKKGEEISLVKGMYVEICEKLRKKRIPFGNAFITTKENIDLVCDMEFAQMLKYYGSHFFAYMSYIRAREDGTEHLELGASQKTRLKEYVEEVKEAFSDAVAMFCPDDLISLGGDSMPDIGYFVIKSNGDIETLNKENRTYEGLTVKGVPLLESLKEFYVLDSNTSLGVSIPERII